MLNASEISSCITESLGSSSNCIATTNSSVPLEESILSAAGCDEAVGFACQALDQVSDDSCTEITRDYLNCLLIRQFAGCNSIECVNAVVPENEEDSFVSSSLGLMLILFGSVALLVLLDFSCEKRFLCRRSCRGETRRQEPNRKGGQTQPNQQLPTSSENQSPSTSEDEIVHTHQRIESLRNKRRDIENWVEHKKESSPEKQASASGARRENGEAHGFL